MPVSVLLSQSDIEARIRELAQAVRNDYGDEPLLLLAVLKGSFLFVADLCRALGGEVVVDFIQVSSYGTEKTSSGIVQIKKDADMSLEGRHVLIVEDIVDTGATLSHLRELLLTRRPKSLKVVALLSKPAARKVEVPVEYLGFEIPNQFVVGYGLDHAERFRNLPFVGILSEEQPS
jgi:hypoxanthine phosphoribosyltransferase